MSDALYPDGMFRIEEFPQGVMAPAGRTIHVSAQGALDGTMKVVGGDSMTAQARQAWKNVEAVLEAAGASPQALVSSITYLVAMDHDSVAQASAVMVEAIRMGALPAHATTMVGVTRLPHPDMLIEISAVAIV